MNIILIILIILVIILLIYLFLKKNESFQTTNSIQNTNTNTNPTENCIDVSNWIASPSPSNNDYVNSCNYIKTLMFNDNKLDLFDIGEPYNTLFNLDNETPLSTTHIAGTTGTTGTTINITAKNNAFKFRIDSIQLELDAEIDYHSSMSISIDGYTQVSHRLYEDETEDNIVIFNGTFGSFESFDTSHNVILNNNNPEHKIRNIKFKSTIIRTDLYDFYEKPNNTIIPGACF